MNSEIMNTFDVNKNLYQAKYYFKERQFFPTIIKCSIAIEKILVELYKMVMPNIINPKERIEIIALEEKYTSGKGYKYFMLGTLIQFVKKSNLLNITENIFDIDIGIAKEIQFDRIKQYRNMAVYSNIEEQQFMSEASIVLFQTQTLWECLSIIMQDNIEEERNILNYNTKRVSSIDYLKLKIKSVSNLPENLEKSINEALKYAIINTEDAIFKLRKILEYMVGRLYKQIGGNPEKTTLDNMLNKLLHKGQIPNRIYKHMDIVKKFGNKGAHPGDEKYNLSDLESTFISLIIIVEWFLLEKLK